jgi:hypothetical protein
MKRLDGFTLGGQAVLWEGGANPILFVLGECRLKAATGLIVEEVGADSPLESVNGEFRLITHTVYRLTTPRGVAPMFLMR